MKTPLLLLCLASTALCADWPHWRGPDHNGISRESDWNARWEGDPPILWKARVAEGFSSMSVADGRLFTMGMEGKKEIVHCLDALTGRELWKHDWPSSFKPQFYEGGSSGTPTVADGTVYVLGLTGEVRALEASSGRLLWQKNIAEELDLKAGTWGFVGAPLVLGDTLVLNAGTHGTALDRRTGKILWKSGPEPTGYSTPLPASPGGTEAVLLMGKEALHAVDPRTGRLLWEQPWKTQYDVNAADPVIWDDRVLISSGYGRGAALVQISGGKPSVLWENRELRTQMNPAVIIEGHAYGFDGNERQNPDLACIDLKTGKAVWRQGGLGHGALAAAGGKLIVLSEKGELIIAPATPEGFQPLSRAQILSGKCWTVPVLANGLLYARNWKGDLVCLDLRPAGEKSSSPR